MQVRALNIAATKLPGGSFLGAANMTYNSMISLYVYFFLFIFIYFVVMSGKIVNGYLYAPSSTSNSINVYDVLSNPLVPALVPGGSGIPFVFLYFILIFIYLLFLFIYLLFFLYFIILSLLM